MNGRATQIDLRSEKKKTAAADRPPCGALGAPSITRPPPLSFLLPHAGTQEEKKKEQGKKSNCAPRPQTTGVAPPLPAPKVGSPRGGTRMGSPRQPEEGAAAATLRNPLDPSSSNSAAARRPSCSLRSRTVARSSSGGTGGKSGAGPDALEETVRCRRIQMRSEEARAGSPMVTWCPTRMTSGAATMGRGAPFCYLTTTARRIRGIRGASYEGAAPGGDRSPRGLSAAAAAEAEA